MPKNKTLSVVIVTHNNGHFIKQSLDLLKQALIVYNKSSEVIVVDNASTDNTSYVVKKEKWVDFIESSENKGYAWANNQGLKKATGACILLLNSDVLIKDPSVITVMTTYLEKNPKVGVVTCKVLLENGNIDPACHRGFPTPWASFTYMFGLEKLFPKVTMFSQYHQWYKDIETIHEIDSCSGAFYLTRKEVVNKVGFLDESFFMYGEDLDYSYRVKSFGWKVVFNPEASVLHVKYQSGLKSKNKETKKRTISAFYNAMLIFYRKHYESKYPSIVSLAIVASISVIKNIKLLLS